jgi:hypothetical protein
MPSTVRATKTTAFENICAVPFTQIHGRPSQSDYKILKHEAATLASKVEDITYTCSCNAANGDEFGLLAKILGLKKYYHQTGIDTYVDEGKPDTYDLAITGAMPTHTQKQLEVEWERTCTCWYI